MHNSDSAIVRSSTLRMPVQKMVSSKQKTKSKLDRFFNNSIKCYSLNILTAFKISLMRIFFIAHAY